MHLRPILLEGAAAPADPGDYHFADGTLRFRGAAVPRVRVEWPGVEGAGSAELTRELGDALLKGRPCRLPFLDSDGALYEARVGELDECLFLTGQIVLEVAYLGRASSEEVRLLEDDALDHVVQAVPRDPDAAGWTPCFLAAAVNQHRRFRRRRADHSARGKSEGPGS